MDIFWQYQLVHAYVNSFVVPCQWQILPSSLALKPVSFFISPAFQLLPGKRALRRADQNNAKRTVDYQKNFINRRPQQVIRLLAVLVADRLDDEGKEDGDPGPIGAAEAGGVK